MDIYVAGALAAFTVDVLIYPFDTLKTRRQSQDYLKSHAQSGKNGALALRGLYQGIGSVVLATLPAAGVFFSTYEVSKTALSEASLAPLPAVHALASATAEAASCVVLTPAELVKQHAQMMRSSRSGGGGGGGQPRSTSLRALRGLYEAGAGWRLFTGYTALLARNLPLTALQFPVFEHLRARIWAARRRRRGRGGRGQRVLETGVIAGVSAAGAGALAALATTPSDVVKTRMMLLAGRNSSSSSSNGADDASGGSGRDRRAAQQQQQQRRRRPWRVARQIYAESGTRGLFRGGGLRTTWTAVGSGLYLGTYDAAKLWLASGQGRVM